MKKINLLLLLTIGIIGNSFSQIANPNIVTSRKSEDRAAIMQKSEKGAKSTSAFHIDPNSNLQSFIRTKLFGKCISVSNVTLNSTPISKSVANAVGVFVDSSNSFGMTSGLLMTTGNAFLAEGPNNSNGAGEANGTPGDPLVGALIPGYTTYNATILEFDFVPLADSILAFEFVFGSEEYPEYVNSTFNDVFGFFMSGPGFNGNENIALVPGTTIPVAINNVNDSLNSTFYVNNAGGTNLQYDGYTTVIPIVHSVVPLATYHLKIVIADAGDEVYDSGVFLKSNSFYGLIDSVTVDFNYELDTATKSIHNVHFINSSAGATEYFWDFGDGTTSVFANPFHVYTDPGTYTVTLTAQNHCYTETTTRIVNIEVLGINEVIENNLLNLASLGDGKYSIRTSFKNQSNVELKVYSINGQIIYQNKFSGISELNENIDLSSFAKGIYQLQLVSGTDIFSSKLVR